MTHIIFKQQAYTTKKAKWVCTVARLDQKASFRYFLYLHLYIFLSYLLYILQKWYIGEQGSYVRTKELRKGVFYG